MLNYIAIGISAFLLAEPLRNESSGNLAADHGRCRRRRACPTSTSWSRRSASTSPTASCSAASCRSPSSSASATGCCSTAAGSGSTCGSSGANAAAARTSGVNPKRMVLDDDHPVRRRRRADRPRPADDRGVHLRRPVPEDARLHRASPWPCSGRNHPVGIAAAALVWATIERATQPLSTIGIPQEIGVILQGSFLLAAVIAYEVVKRWTRRRRGQSRGRDERRTCRWPRPLRWMVRDMTVPLDDGAPAAPAPDAAPAAAVADDDDVRSACSPACSSCRRRA